VTLVSDRKLDDVQRAALWLALARMRQELFAHPRVMLEAAAQARDLTAASATAAGWRSRCASTERR
jgi:hypothetical protein